LNIPIWEGSSSFSASQTPFGFYDTDTIFQAEADKVAKWCAVRLGYPLMDVELQSGSFYAALEEATTVYGNEIYLWKVRDNYLSMEGNSTSSNLNNALIVPSLGNTIRIAKQYGAEAGSGGNVNWYTGSLALTASVQEYDLNAWATASGISSSIELKRIFYEGTPAIVRFFDPYAGTGMGMNNIMESFGFGNMSPGISFMLMPVSFDVLKMQAIEFNDTVRKSAYSFEVHNNKLRIFPIPTDNINLRFEFIKIDERDSVINNEPGNQNLITNISNVPYTNPVYSQINTMGKQWIYQYALAISKEMLGYIRGKYSSGIPAPGSEVTLNSSDLIASATKDKDALLEQLRLVLEETSRKAQLERRKEETSNLQEQLNSVPLPIYIF
jgi:hypothetical protein